MCFENYIFLPTAMSAVKRSTFSYKTNLTSFLLLFCVGFWTFFITFCSTFCVWSFGDLVLLQLKSDKSTPKHFEEKASDHEICDGSSTIPNETVNPTSRSFSLSHNSWNSRNENVQHFVFCFPPFYLNNFAICLSKWKERIVVVW